MPKKSKLRDLKPVSTELPEWLIRKIERKAAGLDETFDMVVYYACRDYTKKENKDDTFDVDALSGGIRDVQGFFLKGLLEKINREKDKAKVSEDGSIELFGDVSIKEMMDIFKQIAPYFDIDSDSKKKLISLKECLNSLPDIDGIDRKLHVLRNEYIFQSYTVSSYDSVWKKLQGQNKSYDQEWKTEVLRLFQNAWERLTDVVEHRTMIGITCEEYMSILEQIIEKGIDYEKSKDDDSGENT